MAITANGTVRSIAHRVLDQLNTFPAIGFHLPASFQNLDRIEELLEAPLDPQVRELIALGDGETIKSPGIFYGMRALRTDDIIAFLQSDQGWVHWLPFARDGQGRLLGVQLAEDPNVAGPVTAMVSVGAQPVTIADNIADLLSAVLASLERREGYPEVLRIRTKDAWSAPYSFGLNDGSGQPVHLLSILDRVALPLGSGGTRGAVVDPSNPLGSDYVVPIGASSNFSENPIGKFSLHGPGTIGEAQVSTEQRPIGEGLSGAVQPIGESAAGANVAATTAVGAAAAATATAIGAAAAAGAAAVHTAAETATSRDQGGTASESVVPEPAPPIPPVPPLGNPEVAGDPSAAIPTVTATETSATVEQLSLPTADLGALAMLNTVPGLRSLELPDLTPILEHLEPLGKLSGLRKLSVQSAYQPVLDQLRKLKNLEELTVKNSMFYALNYLKSFPKLEKLEFVDTTIQNASVLGELKNLKSLHLENTFIENGFDAILGNPSITDFVGDVEQTRLFNEYRGRRN